MMKFFLLVIALAQIYVQPILAKAAVHPKPIDSGEAFNVIREHYKGVLPQSFFVILGRTSIAANTNAPAIIKEYTTIKAFKECKDVLVVFEDDALIGEDHLDSYFKNRYFLDTARHRNTRIVVDGSLVTKLSPDLTLAELLYIHDGKLWYRDNCKHGNVGGTQLPYAPFNIELDFTKQLNIKQAPHTLSNYYAPLNDSMLVQVSEYNSRIGVLNIASGELEQTLFPSAINAIDVYQRLVTQDEQDVKIAEKLELLLKSQNRQTVSFETPFITKEHIYVIGDIQVMTKLKADYKYFDEAQIAQTIEKGSLFANDFPILVKCNYELEIQDVIYIKDRSFPNGEGKFFEARPNFGLLIKDSLLYSFNYPDYKPRTHTRRKRKKASYAVSEFYLENHFGSFKSFKPVPFLEDMGRKDEAFSNTRFFEWNDKLYFNYEIDEVVYDVETGDEAFSLFDDGSSFEEYYKFNTLDTTTNKTRHSILSQGPILNGQYYAFVFFFKNDLYLEVFDKRENSIQLISLNEFLDDGKIYPGFDPENFVLTPNGFTFMYAKSRKLYFDKFIFKPSVPFSRLK